MGFPLDGIRGWVPGYEHFTLEGVLKGVGFPDSVLNQSTNYSYDTDR